MAVSAPDRNHIFHQYTLRVLNGKRDALQKSLNDAGIGTMFYYPVPLHLQDCFKPLGYRQGDLPESEQARKPCPCSSLPSCQRRSRAL